jgi:hypothetical protein
VLSGTVMNLSRILALGCAFSAVACGAAAGGGGGTGTSKQALEALVPLQGCGEVETFLRDRLVADVNAYVDAAIKQVDASQYGGCYGGGYAEEGDMAPTAGAASSSSSSSSGASSNGAAPPPSPGKGASQTSTTNNQVATVDEADFVKNDDTYLYVVANGALRIVKAWPANEAKEIANVALEGQPRKLFVEGDRALVYIAVPQQQKQGVTGSMPSYSGGGGECTYGYD